MRLTSSCVLAALLLSSSALASPTQKLPFAFDPTKAADPSGTQAAITQAEVGLPDLPAASMTTLKAADATLWMFPESAALLTRAGASSATPAAWPSANACTLHTSFVRPSLLVAGAGASCQGADAAIGKDLADLGACRDVAEPERYALSYAPAKVDANSTATIETLIGLAGEALSHPDAPRAGTLPSDFVPTLRTIVAKIRHDALVTRLTQARAAYDDALARLAANASCFDAAARTKLTADLGTLKTELDDESAWLSKLDAEGKATSQHELVCMQAKSRTRVALPYPSLTRQERELVAFWLGGVYWRMRGGGLMPLGSTQSARFYFLERPYTEIGKLAGGQDGADAANQIYLRVFEGWGEWMDMGRTPGGGDQYADLVGMTSRGQRQVQAAADLLAQRSYGTLPLVEGGLHMGTCYFYAWDQLASYRYADQLQAPYGPFIEGPTAIGEFCSGASIALGFARALLDGVPTNAPPAVDLCANRACGDDGCGGSCGTCGDGLTCDPSGQCTSSTAAPPASAPTSTPTGNGAAPEATPAPATAGESGCATSPARTGGTAALLGVALALAALRRRRG